MDLELHGKRAIVTGGSRGIGLAVARALAAEGCDVALVARDAGALAAAREVVNTGAVVGIEGFDPAEFTEQVNVKVLGYLRCIRAVVPLMRAGGWGRIVTADEVASVVTFLASPRSVAVNGDAISVGGGAIGPIYY